MCSDGLQAQLQKIKKVAKFEKNLTLEDKFLPRS